MPNFFNRDTCGCLFPVYTRLVLRSMKAVLDGVERRTKATLFLGGWFLRFDGMSFATKVRKYVTDCNVQHRNKTIVLQIPIKNTQR